MAATAIEFGEDGLLTADFEPVRRGGESALVVDLIENAGLRSEIAHVAPGVDPCRMASGAPPIEEPR